MRLETEFSHLKEALRENLQAQKETIVILRGLPRVMSKKVRRHARECPGNPVATHPPARPPTPPAPTSPEPDWPWVRKALAGLLILGYLIAGWWSSKPIDQPDRPAITAPASPPATTGGNP